MPTVAETIKHQDLTDEQITSIQKKIVTQAKKDEYFDKFCEHSKWGKGSKTLSYRRLIYPKVDPSEVKPAVEGVAPRPTKIAYATFETSVDDYRDKVPYTDESIRYNFDDVVRDAGATLGYKFTQKLDYIKGKPFISSKARITAESTLIKTMRKAKIILGKNMAKHWAQGNYLMIASPEGVELLRDELEAKGSSLDEGTKVTLTNGTVLPAKKSFIISECPSDLLMINDHEQYVVFMGRTNEGKSPVEVKDYKDVEVINNPLGSGVLLDEDGNITADDNKQQGSVAMNALGLGAAVTDDMCILVCKFSIDAINGSDLAMSERTGFVSSSDKSKLTFSVLKATDGTALANATITVKADSATGDAVTATNGVYTLTAGRKYYYSVALSGYTTVTGFVNANADNKELVISLVASN